MHKTIFLDTNIFLHYQPFDQIDWLEVAQAETATIVIPPVTIRELNKHKDSHGRPQVKKRAGETLKKLYGIFELGPNASIRENVGAVIEDRDPAIDFASLQLNPVIQDDQLIASIIMWRQENPSGQVLLVTSDLGLTLLSKAGRQGITAAKLSDHLRIPEEPDPEANKVRQLERQIRELTTRVPSLSLTYEDSSQRAEFRLSKPAALDQSDVERTLAELRLKYPPRPSPDAKQADVPPGKRDRISALALGGISNIISPEEFDRYNKEAEAYLAVYPEYLAKRLERENLERRTIRLETWLANDGTLPAEDVDVYMHFPDGFRLYEEHDLPKPLNVPKEPEPPMTQIERLNRSIRSFQHPYPAAALFDLNRAGGPPPNVSSPSIKHVKSYEVRIHVQRVKHNLAAHLDPLFVVFDSFESSQSFTVEYQILAANIPKPVLGELHVIIRTAQESSS